MSKSIVKAEKDKPVHFDGSELYPNADEINHFFFLLYFSTFLGLFCIAKRER